MHPLFGIFLIRHRYGWHDSVIYVVPPNNWLKDVCMYVVLNLVMLLLCDLHRNFYVVEALLVLFHIFHVDTQLVVVI